MIDYKVMEPEQKALEINLDNAIYGTFAEIGAGQEVARYFFKVGAAAGTIAKTMSAYDKTFSDTIYGPEPTGRYVCESRVFKMLEREYQLMESRLSTEMPETCFFAFADTVSTVNYTRTIDGHGWMGIRFQLKPGGGSNIVVLHLNMLDHSAILQQQAVGILGVNLIYASFKYFARPEILVRSLIENIRGRIQVDMIYVNGPQFEHIDNRLLSLYLVKHQLSPVGIFNEEGRNVHGSEFLYKKQLLLTPASFQPYTNVHQDMMHNGFEQFVKDQSSNPGKGSAIIAEIPYEYLTQQDDVNEKDFMDRVELLNRLGYTVMVSRWLSYRELVQYFYSFKVSSLGMVMGVRRLTAFMHETYQKHSHIGLLSAIGELFNGQIRVYLYPASQEGTHELITAENLPVPDGIRFLYRHLLDSHAIVDIKNADSHHLHIFSSRVYQMIRSDETGWEDMVPRRVEEVIKSSHLFNYPVRRITFAY